MSEDTEYESEAILEFSSRGSLSNKNVSKIVEAMGKMLPIEFATSTGMPKISSIEKMCGFKPTVEEREEAFKGFKALSPESKDAESVAT